MDSEERLGSRLMGSLAVFGTSSMYLVIFFWKREVFFPMAILSDDVQL